MISGSPRSAGSPPPAPGPLAAAMMALAGTPEHSSTVGVQLVSIARLTVERVTAARYASVTALRGRTYTTVAVSDDLIQAIDDAQYADGAGPCLDALRRSTPVGVPAIDTAVQWPGFREAAPRMGLHASVSVPLFAGRGDAIAALNVYSHDRAALGPLIAGISLAHEFPVREDTDEERLSELDVGGRELVIGYAEALGIRNTIRLAIELIRNDNHCDTDDAYLSLCIRAGEAGIDLAEAATTYISHGI